MTSVGRGDFLQVSGVTFVSFAWLAALKSAHRRLMSGTGFDAQEIAAWLLDSY